MKVYSLEYYHIGTTIGTICIGIFDKPKTARKYLESKYVKINTKGLWSRNKSFINSSADSDSRKFIDNKFVYLICERKIVKEKDL